MRPAARLAVPVDAAPACLRVRHVAVWGDHPGDELAPRRWRAAATTWRAAAHARGVPAGEVWRACPDGRFGLGDDALRLRWLLERAWAGEDDVRALADQARTTWPHLFLADVAPAATRADTGWHLRGR